MYLAGGFAWGVGSLIECPIDFLKTQLQIQIIKSKTIKEFKPEFQGIKDLAKKIWNTNGLTGFYQGLSAQLLRNIPGGALLFGTFELYRNKTADRLNCEVKDLPISHSLLGGALGGLLFWGPLYPVDVIKSTIQADSINKDNRKYKTIIDTGIQLYNEGGYRRFYKGFSPCILRAVPANAVLLLTSTFISEHLMLIYGKTDQGVRFHIVLNLFK